MIWNLAQVLPEELGGRGKPLVSVLEIAAQYPPDRFDRSYISQLERVRTSQSRCFHQDDGLPVDRVCTQQPWRALTIPDDIRLMWLSWDLLPSCVGGAGISTRRTLPRWEPLHIETLTSDTSVTRGEMRFRCDFGYRLKGLGLQVRGQSCFKLGVLLPQNERCMNSSD